jgi:hypothetical protein
MESCLLSSLAEGKKPLSAVALESDISPSHDSSSNEGNGA